MKFTVLTMAVALLAAPLNFSFASGIQDEIEVTRSLHQLEKKAVIASALELDDENGKKFWPMYNEYQDALRKVEDQRIQIIVEYAENYAGLTDEMANDLVKRMFAYEEALLKLKKSQFAKFNKVFPSVLVARYFQAENKIQAITNYGIAQQIPLAK